MLMSNFVYKKAHARFVFKVKPLFPRPQISFFPGENEELGPPPSVDEAADALMTRLGFLLGDKIIPGQPESSYPAQDDGEVVSPAPNTFTVTLNSLCVL